MSVEQEARLEASKIVLPALKRELASFEGITSFRESSDDMPGNFQEKESFRSLTTLSLAAQKLNANPQEWAQRVEDRRQALKQEMAELGDVITCIEVDEVYCDYLMNVGEVDRAVDIALHITDGYDVPEPLSKAGEGFMAVMGARMQKQQFEGKHDHVLVDLAYKFIKNDDLARAAELVADINLNDEGYLYFAGILDYHKQREDVIAIEGFITDMDARSAISKADTENYRESWRFLTALSNQAKQALTEIAAKSGNLDGAMANLESITVGNHRVREQTKFVEKLLEEGNIADARYLAQVIITNLNENTSQLRDKKFRGDEDDEDESETEQNDETIGSLDFLNKEEPQKYDFRNYDRAEYLCELAKALSKSPECQDLYELCINGDENALSIAESIRLSNKSPQPSLWSHLIEASGKGRNLERLEEVYKRGCVLYPDSVDFLTMRYAYELYEFDQQKALELILNNPNLERRADAYASFVRAQVEENGFKGWEELMTQLVTLEDEVLKTEESDFSIEDLSPVDDNENEDPDFQVVTSISSGSSTIGFRKGGPPEIKFWRKSPGLLANLAKLAITKGEWDAFGKIFKDERMTPDLKVTVLTEVTDWLQEGKEIKFWF